jgi:hypothetical protein
MGHNFWYVLIMLIYWATWNTKDNIKMDLGEIGWEGDSWINPI